MSKTHQGIFKRSHPSSCQSSWRKIQDENNCLLGLTHENSGNEISMTFFFKEYTTSVTRSWTDKYVRIPPTKHNWGLSYKIWEQPCLVLSSSYVFKNILIDFILSTKYNSYHILRHEVARPTSLLEILLPH